MFIIIILIQKTQKKETVKTHDKRNQDVMLANK